MTRDGSVLRDFEPRDQDAVGRLIVNGMVERWGERFDPAANPDTADLWATYVEPGGEIVVYELDGDIIATGTLIPEADGAGRIVRMSVDRRHRRRGFAKIVVGELIERARHRSLDPLHVETDTPWFDAVEFYRACGFTLVRQNEAASHFVMSLAIR